MSRVLIIATLLFLAFTSSVLAWEGLATGVFHGRSLARADLRRVRVRFAMGVIVLAIVLWIALGILMRTW